MLRLRRQSGGLGNRKVEGEGANDRVLIHGGETRAAPRYYLRVATKKKSFRETPMFNFHA